jgi:hypothetical protein
LPLPFGPATRTSSPGAAVNERPRKSARLPRSHASSNAESTLILLQKGFAPLGQNGQWRD